MNEFPAVLLEPGRPFDRIRQLYLYREPELLGAIRCGDRRGARSIINHLLVHIYSVGEQHNELLKGLLLELVVMMARAAVEKGASQQEALGLHFRHLSELARLEDEEELSDWLRTAMERLFTLMEGHSDGNPGDRVQRILDHMRAQLGRPLPRGEVARWAGLSPGHLSLLMRRATGSSYSALLLRYRVDAASLMLRQGDQGLAEIAAACGFCDQSHFTRAFRAMRGMTPRQYRRSPAAARPA